MVINFYGIFAVLLLLQFFNVSFRQYNRLMNFQSRNINTIFFLKDFYYWKIKIIFRNVPTSLNFTPYSWCSQFQSSNDSLVIREINMNNPVARMLSISEKYSIYSRQNDYIYLQTYRNYRLNTICLSINFQQIKCKPSVWQWPILKLKFILKQERFTLVLSSPDI